jgi:hypothetical protein
MSNGHKFRGRELDITVIVTKFFCLFSLSCYFSSSSDTDTKTDDKDLDTGGIPYEIHLKNLKEIVQNQAKLLTHLRHLYRK